MNTSVKIYNIFDNLDKLSDVRTRGYPLVDSIWGVLVIIAAYNFLVWKGVEFMKSRQPYKFKYISIIYNILILLINAYVTLEYLRHGLVSLRYSLVCNKNTKNDTHPMELQMIRTGYIFFISKIIELLDTAFIVLGKREKSLSFLHLYHHSTVPISWWIIEKWIPTGDSIIFYIGNAAVHVIMYLYYMLSSLGPEISKFLWWKKYLTILQLIQFFYGIFSASYRIIMDCPYIPYWYNVYLICYLLSFAVLFGNFYWQTYPVRKQKAL